MENPQSLQKIEIRIKGRRYYLVLDSGLREERVRILERQGALDWLADLHFSCGHSEEQAKYEFSAIFRDKIVTGGDE